MSATAPADFWDKFHGERPGEAHAPPIAPRDAPRGYPPRRKRRPLRALFRFMLMVGIGVGGTLAWQAYGDMAREMAATAYPQQLGWVMPPATAATPGAASAAAPAATTGAAAPVASPEQQQLAAISAAVADVRRSVDILAAQVATNQQQVASSQQEMTATIERLQASEQDVLAKLAAPPPRPARPAPTHRPVPLALSPAATPAAATH